MDTGTWTALALSFKVSTVATLLVLIPATALAYLLARKEFPGKKVLSTVLLLPLVLPPTAVGFILLRILAQDGPLGRQSLGFDLGFLLTWRGAVLAASVMALPLVVRTARVTFEGIDPRLEMMARTLGHSRLRTFVGTTLPLAVRGLSAAAILGFTRALGEFGATVTLAGSIPGRTRTLASAIFAAQQTGDDSRAYVLCAVALVAGFVSILASEALAGSSWKRP
ncbi:MAG: molybdate ABC transporter permease subunit [Acidobacteriota bacterium]